MKIPLLQYTPEQRKQAFLVTAQKKHLPEPIIEKDWWVTHILNLLFSLPFAEQMVFKGGTSLSKAWQLIERFSEDIDIAINPTFFGISGSPTKKQIKQLRKRSSLFVAEELSVMLQNALDEAGLSTLCSMNVQPNGEGDNTYPEPRTINISYQSVYQETSVAYVRPVVTLEIGARSLFEPSEKKTCQSLLSEILPIADYLPVQIQVTIPQKTFLEKVFLLHELFSIERNKLNADRKSRHLYDLERMMDTPIAIDALHDDELWEHIRQHRMAFTAMTGVDYNANIREHLCLTPPQQWLHEWEEDYKQMCQAMIYGRKLSFSELINRMHELENRFRENR